MFRLQESKRHILYWCAPHQCQLGQRVSSLIKIKKTNLYYYLEYFFDNFFVSKIKVRNIITIIAAKTGSFFNNVVQLYCCWLNFGAATFWIWILFLSCIPYFREQFPRKLFFFEFNLMYCDLWQQYIQVRKLFKGGNYSRKYDSLFVLFQINLTLNFITQFTLAQHLMGMHLLCYSSFFLQLVQQYRKGW